MSMDTAVIVSGVLLVAVLLVLAWRRKRHSNLKELQERRPQVLTQARATNVAAPAKTDIPPTTIALGPTDAPYVQISRALIRPDYTTEELAPNAVVHQEVRSWLQHVPRLAVNGNLLAANRYVVSFSPEVTRALSNGSMELMQSSQGGYYATAVTADGRRIVQTGMIEKAGFPVAAIPGLLWQVAAIVTAQRFLSDINKQLAKIGEAVEFIKRYLEAERIGTVQASFDRLTEIIAAMNSGRWELDDARRWVGMLDDLDLACSGIVRAGQAQKQDLLTSKGS